MDDALYNLWDKFNRASGETVRVDASDLAAVGGGALVPASYRGGATVEVKRCALFNFLKNH
jgi:hypothetical protein